ncbi:hypothetical protein [Tsukamurella sp. NPDC003166]|uniref:DUF7373 family lipoprotein n=1 Tax=Tsukamurella sp. NPDC003166 TaxID=3154444 RepID=UPI0033A661FA
MITLTSTGPSTRARRAACALAVVATIAGCSSTAGEPTAPSSAAPHLDTGGFATSARTITASTRDRKALEMQRMFTTMPVVTDIVPSMTYIRAVHNAAGESVADAFGSGVAAATKASKFGNFVAYGDSAEAGASSHEFIVALMRMPSAEEATAAATAPSVLAADTPPSDQSPTPKTPLPLAGQPSATAYSKTTNGKTSVTALLPAGRLLIAVRTSIDDGPSVTTRFLTEQVAALRGFTPTPDDRLGSLPTDSDGVRSLTLAHPTPADGTLFTDGWATARGLLNQVERPARTRTDVADAGVDVVGLGASNVYRARDAAGATLLAGRLVAAYRQDSAGSSVSTVDGVPGATCVTATKDRSAQGHCVVPVGRYVGEYTSRQPAKSAQAIAAQYLILRSAPQR